MSISASAVCIAAADCSAGDPTTLWISPAQLASGGFSSYSLSADQGGLSVAAGTSVTLKQDNLILPGDFAVLRDRPTLIGSATQGLLADQLRQPVNLALTQSVPATEITGVVNTLAVTAATPSLVIGEGALIQADPKASIALASNVRILEDGTLRAPAGTISRNRGSNQIQSSYSGTQAIGSARKAYSMSPAPPRFT